MNTELSCSQCRDALVELTAETLNPTARQAVERHLASCPDCQRERDNWLALGDAIRESGRLLPPDGGFSTGLVRLRAALTLQTDDFTNPEGEKPSMELDPHPTDTRASTPLPSADLPSTTTVSRGRPYPAIAATLALVLVSALVFGTLATRMRFGSGNTAAATATPTPSTSTRSTVPALPPLANGANVVSISMVSASDGWAVATLRNSITARFDSTLLHYTNGHWELFGNVYTNDYLKDISMDSHDDGWAVGDHWTSVGNTDQYTSVVLHYSGGHWSQIQTPNFQFQAYKVRAFSPSQVVVLTTLSDNNNGSIRFRSALERYDNSAWTESVSPEGLGDMTVLSADNIWALAIDKVHVLHYVNGQWTTYTIAGVPSGQSVAPSSISMLSDSEGWVGGFNNTTQHMFLAHFDGHTWTQVAGPATSGPMLINTIAMLSPEEGWAGGGEGGEPSHASLLHYIHGQWQATSDAYSGSIGTIIMASPTEGWATVGGGSSAGLLHYKNGRWTPYNPNA
ncbi:MAG TPA: anti-sigma factor [Ktedonobacterales bacterium]